MLFVNSGMTLSGMFETDVGPKCSVRASSDEHGGVVERQGITDCGASFETRAGT